MCNNPTDYSANIATVLDEIAVSSLGKNTKSFFRSSPISPSYISRLFVLAEPSKMFNASYEEMTQYAHDVLGFLKVSRQALAARISPLLVAFMEQILARAIASIMPSPRTANLSKSLKIKGVERIRLGDCTIIQLPDCMKEAFPGTGGSGKASKSSVKIFHEFDLLGNFTQFLMAAGKTSDASFNVIKNILSGDLILRDMGFKDLAFFAKVKAAGAFFIQRLYCKTVIYLVAANGELSKLPMNIDEFARKNLDIKANKGKTHLSFDVQLGTKVKNREAMGTVRLIAFRISDEKAAQKVAHARKEAQRNGQKLSKAKEILCHWHICFTNLSEEQATMERVIEIYRLRWQIELRFKSWKSTLRIDTVTVQSGDRLKCAILGYFTKMTLLGDIFTDAKLKAEEEETAIFEQGQADKGDQNTAKGASKKTPDTISDAKLFKIMANYHYKIVEAFIESREKLRQLFDKILSNLMKKAKKDIKQPKKQTSKQKT